IHDAEVPGDLYRSCYDGPGIYCEAERGNPTLQKALALNPDGLFFACQSLDQLREWFFSPKGCTAMGTAGGLLATYEVPDEAVYVGIAQVLFEKAKATRVSAIDAGLLHLTFSGKTMIYVIRK